MYSPTNRLVTYRVLMLGGPDKPPTPMAYITLNVPEKRNALSTELLHELQTALDHATHDDVLAVVLAGQGPAFCAGVDLNEALQNGVSQSARALADALHTILKLPKPVVARIHGPTRAGGIGLVAACDIAISSDKATYAFSEARLALAPSVISWVVLPRMESRAAARTFLTGTPFTAVEAADWGLVTTTVASEMLDQEIHTALADLSASDPQGLAATKKLLNADLLEQFEAHIDEAVTESVRLFSSTRARTAMERLTQQGTLGGKR